MKYKKRTIDFKYNFKEYLNIVKKYRWSFLLMLILVLIIEASYTLSRYFFKLIVDKGTEFANNEVTREAFVSLLLIIAVLYIVMRSITPFLKLIRFRMLVNITTKSIADLKRKYFNHIVHLSHKFHKNHKTGSLISRLIRGGHAIDGMNDVIVFNLAPMLFQLILVAGSIFYFDLASAITVIMVSIAFISWSVYVQNKAKPWGDAYNKREDREKGTIGDVMTNIDSIKYFGKENLIKSRFKKVSEDTKKSAIKFWNHFGLMDLGQMIILSIGVFLLVYFPITRFLNGEITMGTVVFIYSIFGNIVGNLFGFVHGIRQYYKAMIDFEDLFQYGRMENDIKDKPNAEELKIKNGEVEFNNVGFKFWDGKKRIFNNFNLKVKPNQKVALVGHSGCGKTSLLKLLYRLYDVDEGEVLVDGKNIKDLKQESLRSELSIVPQEPVLFDDSIYNNIAFSNPKATRKQVMAAMKFAQLDKVVKGFPKQENTIVGERGVKLSGGEKQRVSIARAILADKKVLVLDEATSALDSETEHEIQRDLARLMEGRTSIIIAHRLSTIMHADKIIVMDKGKIVQTGKHRDLIRKYGQYRKLWDLQKGGYIKE